MISRTASGHRCSRNATKLLFPLPTPGALHVFPSFTYHPPEAFQESLEQSGWPTFDRAALPAPLRRLNLVLLAVLLVVAILAAGGTYLVHEAQVRRHASSFLDRVRQAETDGNLERAKKR